MNTAETQRGWWRWRRLVGRSAAGLAAILVVSGLMLKHEPSLPAVSIGPDADRAAGRLVSKAAALHSAVSQGGAWETSLTDTEVNAWLATDLPRNHPHLLPRRLSEPRVRFRPQRVEAAIRAGSGLLSTVVRCELAVTLRGVNQLGISVEAAAAGAMPLPKGPVLAALGGRLTAAGAVTELRRLDGRTLLVVYIPASRGGRGPEWRLESLRIDDGEMVVAGTTPEPKAAPARAGTTTDGP